MAGQSSGLSGPDFEQGVEASKVPENRMLLGHYRGVAVILTRVNGRCSAVGATCTHYGAPLIDGILVDGTIRCPWHHACFSVAGDNLRPPALDGLARYGVEDKDGRVRIVGEMQFVSARGMTGATLPDSVVIIGAGAAGEAAAEELRRAGYRGAVTMIDPDASALVDRPNLSKDYLAGNAQPEWIPLRGADFFDGIDVKLLRGHEVKALDANGKRVTLDTGEMIDFGAAILATGAEPIRLKLDGDGPPVMYLRSLADSDAIIHRALNAKCVAVLGASFIGLEVAASLRTRGLDVHVVAPESRPLERVLGAEVGDFVRGLHEAKGVTFHLGRTAKSLAPGALVLDDGSKVACDLVVAGVGVRPRVALAEAAGLSVDRGIVVDEYLQTSAPGIYAAGDIAKYPDPHNGSAIRVEHWVVAQRQGRAAARNALGARQRFDAVPFFWSAHYDTSIRYVGHAERFDAVAIDGDLGTGDAAVRYLVKDKAVAIATIGRDKEALEFEAQLERSLAANVKRQTSNQ